MCKELGPCQSGIHLEYTYKIYCYQTDTDVDDALKTLRSFRLLLVLSAHFNSALIASSVVMPFLSASKLSIIL